MAIHIHQALLQIRIYNNGIDVNRPLYDMSKVYKGVISIFIDEDGNANATLAVINNLTISDFREILNYCRKNGAITFSYKHRNLKRKIDLI